MITVRVTLETEERLSAEELEELVHQIDYEFSSDYAQCSTTIEDADFIISNRAVK